MTTAHTATWYYANLYTTQNAVTEKYEDLKKLNDIVEYSKYSLKTAISNLFPSDATGISHGPCYRRHQIVALSARGSSGIACKYQQNSRPIAKISHRKPLSLLKSTGLPTSHVVSTGHVSV